MREGGFTPEFFEGNQERSAGLLDRLKEGFDFIAETVRSLKPGSREARFLVQAGVLAGVMAGAMPEAHAEPSKWYAHQAEKLEQQVRRGNALAEANIAGGEAQRHEAGVKLKELRKRWLSERNQESRFVDLGAEAPKEVEEYFQRHHIEITPSTHERREARYWYPDSPRYVQAARSFDNVLTLPGGDTLAFDQATYDVQFRTRGETGLDIIAYNVGGDVELYQLDGGRLVSTSMKPHEAQLPYEDIQKKYERKDKRAHFGVPKKK